MKIDVAGGRMRKITWLAMLMLAATLSMSCEEDINNDNSSALISGYVYASPQDQTGVAGVQIIVEGDINSDNPYQGPDRWTETDNNGHYEAWVFLGADEETGTYDYLADFLVQYFHEGALIDSVFGVTLSPGSVFTMPPRYVAN
jgi:hypothetical protein